MLLLNSFEITFFEVPMEGGIVPPFLVLMFSILEVFNEQFIWY